MVQSKVFWSPSRSTFGATFNIFLCQYFGIYKISTSQYWQILILCMIQQQSVGQNDQVLQKKNGFLWLPLSICPRFWNLLLELELERYFQDGEAPTMCGSHMTQGEKFQLTQTQTQARLRAKWIYKMRHFQKKYLKKHFFEMLSNCKMTPCLLSCVSCHFNINANLNSFKLWKYLKRTDLWDRSHQFLLTNVIGCRTTKKLMVQRGALQKLWLEIGGDLQLLYLQISTTLFSEKKSNTNFGN